MNKTLIIGHKNPDTDSIVSALVAEDYYKNILKIDAKACRAGEPNNETKFVLSRFGFSTPTLVKKVMSGENLILVDHNEKSQLVDGVDYSQIVGIIDHHKVIIETEKPIFCRVEPIGSTSSVFAKMYKEAGKKISKSIANLMLAGILSDTLNLTSPTTTESDRKLVKELNKIAKLDLKKLVKELFAAKSSLKGISLETVVSQDYKIFQMGKHKVGIGVWETTDPESINNEENKIKFLLKNKKNKEKLDYMLFVVVDIIRQNGLMYILGQEEESLLQKVFGGEIKKGAMLLEGIVSRKKQLVPPLTKELTK